MKVKLSTCVFIAAAITLTVGFVVASMQFAGAGTEAELRNLAASLGAFEVGLIIAVVLAIIGVVLKTQGK